MFNIKNFDKAVWRYKIIKGNHCVWSGVWTTDNTTTHYSV